MTDGKHDTDAPPPDLKPIAMGRVILALLIWTEGETRDPRAAEETLRELPLDALRGMIDNMEAVVALARHELVGREDRSGRNARTVRMLPNTFATKAELLGFIDASLDDYGNVRPNVDRERLDAAIEWFRAGLKDLIEREAGP